MSALRSPITMVYWSRKQARVSSRSGRCSGLEGGRYSLTSRCCLMPETTSHLTTFGLWKRVESTLHPWGHYLTTRPTPPCVPPVPVFTTGKNTTPWTRRLWKYSFMMILVLVSTMMSKLPSWTPQMVLAKKKYPAIADVVGNNV